MGEEKGDQGDWGEGARREPDSDSEMDVERGGLTPTHSATCTRTSTRSPTARASRRRKPSTAQQGQRESAATGPDWWSSDPPLTRPLTPGWEGVAQIPLQAAASPGLQQGGVLGSCSCLSWLREAEMPPHVPATCAHHWHDGCWPRPRDSSFCSTGLPWQLGSSLRKPQVTLRHQD